MIENIVENLRKLGITGADCVYGHISLKDINLDFKQANEFIDIILDEIGKDTTLVVPSFPFGGSNLDYQKFFGSEKIVFDVKRTPCRINLFSELLRRRKNVYRSKSPIYPVVAIGPRAEEITADTHLDPYPFTKNTSFYRMYEMRTYVIGVGMNMNTNSFIHMIDDDFLEKFPYNVYIENTISCDILENGKLLETRDYYYVAFHLRKKIKPIKFHELIKDKPFYNFFNDGVDYYKLELAPFINFGKTHAKEAFDNNKMPVWHAQKNMNL